MSGFGGWVGEHGSPVPRETISALSAVLARRGPDAMDEWVGGAAAFVHTLFRTTDESAHERQPLVADDRFVLVADARLDARDELIAALVRKGQHAGAPDSDADLLLHAWLAWREDCVNHLVGDFSFVVWDVVRRRLFGARDQFGVRPFFYAAIGSGVVFANMLAAVRAHPGVSAEPDDAAIVDALVFTQFEDVAATPFVAIRRLPGGHSLTWQTGRLTIRRYWSGPVDRPVRYRKDDEYLEHYRERLTRAVADRLRTDRVAVAMTGGLDSSSIAATAAGLLRSRGLPHAVDAHTIVYDHLIPDRERHFAGLAARHIGISISFTAADDRRIYDRAGEPSRQPPEPVDDPFRAMLTDFYRGIASRSRVLLMGLDGDTFLNEVASDYLIARLVRGDIKEYVRGVAEWMRTRRSLPPHRLRSTVRHLLGRGRGASPQERLPAWIAPAMVARFNLDARWAQRPAARQRFAHGWPLHARATGVLASPTWASMFDLHDTEHLGALVEVRFPFCDLRLVEFLMNIPAVPWCIDKYIARHAMTDRLPPEILARPKSPMAGDPVRARQALGDRPPWTDAFRPHPLLDRYVNVPLVQDRLRRSSNAIDASVDLRAPVLNEWLWYHLPRS